VYIVVILQAIWKFTIAMKLPKSPTVCVIIAAYNYGRYLARALESIQAQTFTNWEAIIVDDGSTDDTQTVLQPFLHDDRFISIKTENRGKACALNMAIPLYLGYLKDQRA
jgi:glycosyltransferase involved in cell wall biosynthesis